MYHGIMALVPWCSSSTMVIPCYTLPGNLGPRSEDCQFFITALTITFIIFSPQVMKLVGGVGKLQHNSDSGVFISTKQ